MKLATDANDKNVITPFLKGISILTAIKTNILLCSSMVVIVNWSIKPWQKRLHDP